MTRRRWIILAVTMAISCAILLAIRDGLALAAALMCGISIIQAAEADQ